MTETQRDLVIHLLREGDWQEAVLAYAEEAGVTNREASEAVEALAASHHIERHSFSWLAVAAIASLLLLLAGWVITH